MAVTHAALVTCNKARCRLKNTHMALMTLRLPEALHDEVSAVIDSGLYASEESFVADAVRTLLAARPDLREAVACKMYERGDWSIGRAAEWANLNIEEMKLALHRRGIVRSGNEAISELEEMAYEAIKAAGRDVQTQ